MEIIGSTGLESGKVGNRNCGIWVKKAPAPHGSGEKKRTDPGSASIIATDPPANVEQAKKMRQTELLYLNAELDRSQQRAV